MKHIYQTIIGLSFGWMFTWGCIGAYDAARAHEADMTYIEVGTEIQPPEPEPVNPWRKTVATFYGNPYDSHPSRYRTSDGTPYRSDGMFCATYLVPLGTTIEVRRGKVTLRLVVRDRPARKNGHKLDLPSKTWDRFGAKRSVGVLPVEWRVVKK